VASKRTSNPGTIIVGIVDDDRSLRQSVARLLSSYGFNVVHYGSAEEFLAHDHELDCLVLDIQLPGESGLDLEARLRMRGRSLPVVFMTGQHSVPLHDAVRATGLPCLQKPFDEDGLVSAISEATATA
jgi:FixJ family two-component response regulator